MNVFKVSIKPSSFFTGTFSSFTIFGALCWALKWLFGKDKVEEFIEKIRRCKIVFSSPMPEGYVFKPFLLPAQIEKKEIENIDPEFKENSKFRNFIKYFKKLKFIPWEIFSSVLEGKIKNESELAVEILKFCKNKKIDFFEFCDGLTNIAKTIVFPHAKLDRITHTTSYGGTFFFEEGVYFVKNLYFLLAVSSEEEIRNITTALKFLQDWGFGGNKSTGFGVFSYEIEKFPYVDEYVNQKGQYCIILSPSFIEPNVDFENSFYDLKVYKGIMESDLGRYFWKPKFYYFTEGSLLALKDVNKFPGTIYQIEEDLVQYGIGFPIYLRGLTHEN